MSSDNFVAFGHSHIVALAMAFYDAKAKGGEPWQRHAGAFHYLHAPSFNPVLSLEQDRECLNPSLVALLSEGGEKRVLLAVGGNEHNELCLESSFRGYDFRLGEAPDLPLAPAGEALCPESVVREAMRDRMNASLATIRAFRAASAVPMVYVEPPPPLPREHIANAPHGLSESPELLANLAPDNQRYKVWRVQCALLRACCAAAGIAYLAVPDAVLDSRGLLADAYCGKDATHANAAFGLTLWSRLLEHLP